MTDYYRLTATEVVALTRSGKLTVTDYAKSLLARVAARDADVKAWSFLDPELVLRSAAALDALPAAERGPLHGVAIGVKDVILTKDMPTQYNSSIYKGHAPEMDAGPVQTLRSQGALIFGKTETTEFATCQVGPPTCNPHDRSRTAGGSSSGSGAAVGDFQVPISLGTQTGGSTIRPGSYNSIFAMKPTWNAITREGLKIYSLTCDTLGLYARSVEDLQLLSEVFRLDDDVKPVEAPFEVQGAKFAFVKTHAWRKAEEGTNNAYAKGMELLKAAGAEVDEIELPDEFPKIENWHAWILAAEGRSAFLADYLCSKDQLDPLITGHVENTKDISRKMLLEAYDGCATLRPVIDALAGKYAAIVTPSVTGEAPQWEEPGRFTGDASFNSMWTVLHVPVVNIPGFKGTNGMPVGLSLVGARYHDQELLRVAKAVAPVFAKGGFVNAL